MAGHTPNSFYDSPEAASRAPAEEFLYVGCLHEGTGVEAPDFLAVVDAETGRIIHETPMPNVGDEVHHFGWNRCSSACHGPDRSHLIMPGFRSSRVHILDVADDPLRPRIEKVIEPEELVRATGYTRPHTVHCMPGDNVVMSMLGDENGAGSGGFAVLDAKTFEIKGRWENGGDRPPMNYDFWYQPRKNVLVSSEFGEPNATSKASTSTTSPPVATGAASTSGTSPSGGSSRRSISAEGRLRRLSEQGDATPLDLLKA
jgi:methanethiol oxidase